MNRTSSCYTHHVTEVITRRVYRICGECGHVYTRHSLRKALRREILHHMRHPTPMAGVSLHQDRWHDLRNYVSAVLKPCKHIYFCQECLHDW